jgi:hypothetical protein
MPAKPASPQVPPTEKVQTSYKQLCNAAVDLNTASDELGKAISLWDAALQKLNLGVSAWVELSSGENEGYWWDRGIGYTQMKGRWGLALRDREGHYSAPDANSEEIWPFNEAPRWMRINAVGQIPDLLEALLKQAEDTTKKIKSKITQAYELAEAFGKVMEEEPKPAEQR